MSFSGKERIRTKNAVIEFSTKRLAKLLNPKKIINKATRQALVKGIKEESLELVAVGKSPVKGKGRYRAYAAQRKKRTFKRSIRAGRSGFYPETSAVRNRYPSKKTRPVNLKLDPSMPYLESLFDWTPTKGGVRFKEPKDTFLKVLFNVHNEGERKDIPQRMVVPTGGRDYVSGIRKMIKSIYRQRIKDIIKSNG